MATMTMADFHPAKVIPRIKAGLPTRAFYELSDKIGVRPDRLAQVVGIAPRTLHRRKQAGRFDPFESERVVRIQRLYRRALEVFEDEGAVKIWFISPALALDGATPLDYADTEAGAREVENVLYRIEDGVFM